MSGHGAREMSDEQQDWDLVTAMAAGLVHEIKNPLSTINLNLQLLREDWEDAATVKEARTLKKIQVLQREVERLKGILEDFLRYARVTELDLEPAQLNEVVKSVLEFLAAELTESRIEVRTSLDPNLPLCRIDREFLKQAVLNLCLNAEHAMPEGGELLVKTQADGPDVRLEITDTGVGMSPEAQDKAFRPFYSTKKGGTGLGLATTRRIIQQHGGSIRFHSELGKGTSFQIRLPQAPGKG